MGKLDFTPLRKALLSFASALNSVSDMQFMNSLTAEQRCTMRAGVIQNFEFTYELSWKMLKRQLIVDEGEADIGLLSRKDLFRLGAQKRLIEDPEAWFVFHRARNETSHTYDEKKAEQVNSIAKTFLAPAQHLLIRLEQR